MNWYDMLVGSGSALVRTVVVGVLAYVALVLLLRVSGKRTLSKFNAFDFVVTIALGSTLSSILISQTVSWAQGVLAFVVLLGLQYAITWLSVRSARVRDLVKGEPRLLLFRGELREGAMRDERVTREELQAAARDGGVDRLEDVAAAVLETDGTITILDEASDGRSRAYASVRGHPAHDDGSGGTGRPRAGG